MRVLGLAVLFVGALFPCFSAAAQTEPRIALEASATGIVAHIDPASASGDVLLSSAGRVLGRRTIHNGQAEWSAADLPPGAYVVQASFRGLRSQALAYRVPTNAVNGFSESEKIDSAPKDVKALLVSGAAVTVLSHRGLYTIQRTAGIRARTADPIVGALTDSAALADFDGDGVADLASAVKGHVEALLSARKGGSLVVQDGADPVQLAAADFDGDGMADLAIANTKTGEIRILNGSANGFLPATVARPASGSPVQIAVDDLIGNGRAELVVADAAAGKISVLQSNGSGFTELTAYSAEGTPAAVTTGDFSGLGRADVVWLNSDGSIHIAGRGSPVGRVESGSSLMAAADMNRDGRMDLVFADATGVRIVYGTEAEGVSAAAKVTAKTCAPTVVCSGSDDGTPGTLRYVVTNAPPGSTVTFDSSVTYIYLQCNNSIDCTISVPAGVSINGLGANQTIISGAFFTRIFQLQGNSRISNLGLLNGFARGGNGADGAWGGGGAAGMGGAVFVQGTGNQFQNVVFSGNYAIGGNGGNSHSSGYPTSGGGGGGLGGNGAQGHHGTDYFIYTTYDTGGDGGPGGILGGSGGVGGVNASLDLVELGELLVTLASLQFEDFSEELIVIIRGIATEHGVILLDQESLDTILLYYGIDPTIAFDTQPTQGGPGAGGGGGPQNLPFGMAGGYGGGGGGAADPNTGFGGRSVFGGGIGGGADTTGPGQGGSAYGGAVFIYQGASADFDNCSFLFNEAMGGNFGLKDGANLNPATNLYGYGAQAPGFGGAVYVDVGGQVSYNHGLTIEGGVATNGSFSWGAAWNSDANPGVAFVIPGGNSYSGDALNQAIQGAAPGTTLRFFTASTVNVTSPITISNSVVIDGQNQVTIAGSGGTQLFLVTQGNVAFKNITLTNGKARGGNGGGGIFGGGGGAGAGGAIFIHAGNVTLTGVNFSGNAAIGGVGGLQYGFEGGGGGGSLTAGGQNETVAIPSAGRTPAGGDGGASFLTGTLSAGGYVGSGQVCDFATTCVVTNDQVSAPYQGGGGGLDDWFGSNGGFFGGGGGAGMCPSSGAVSTTCGTSRQYSNAGGKGGYGGGGGAGNPGGAGGQFAGAGQSYPLHLGGGGAGLGGAVYLRSGALTIDSCVFSNNSARGDGDGIGNEGQGKGGAIFNQGGTVYWKGPSTFQGNTAQNAAGTTFDTNDVYGAIPNYATPVPNAPATNVPGLLPAMTAGASPQAIIARDVNGDYIPDLVVETANSVLVFPGRGDGTFGPATSTPISGLHQNGSTYSLPFAGLATGYLDTLATNSVTTILSAQQYGAYILPGGQQAGDVFNLPPAGLAVGDLDNDGFDDFVLVGPNSRGIDVVLSNSGPGSETGQVLAQSGFTSLGNDATIPNYAPGQFTARHRDLVLQFVFVIPSCGSQSFSAVTIGDFNGDGLNDIAAAGPDCVLVAYNQGGGNFNIQSSKGPEVFLGSGPVTSIVPIPTPDGKTSFLVTASYDTSSYYTVYTTGVFGQSSSGFAALARGLSGGAATAGDFNRDGNPDLLITYPATNTASLYLGSSVPNLSTCFQIQATFLTGCGQTSPLATWQLPAKPIAAASADFNGDGYADFAIATSDGNVSILMGRAPLNVTVQRATPTVVGLEEVSYTATVTDLSNVSVGTMTVALTTSAQAGVTGASGTGWMCTSAAPITCSRAVTFGGPAASPITFKVRAAVADATITTTALATIDGLNPSQGSDSVAVSGQANVQVSLSKSNPAFWVNEQGASYAVTVTNGAAFPVDGPFSVSISLPTGLSATSISGLGWTCTLSPLNCNQNGSIAANGSLQPINVGLSVSSANASATTTATLSIPSEPAITGSDTVAVMATFPFTVTATPSSNPLGLGQRGVGITFRLINQTASNFENTSVSASLVADPAVQLVSLSLYSGNSVSCPLSGSCTLPAQTIYGQPSPFSTVAFAMSANIAANAPANVAVTVTFTVPGSQIKQTLTLPVLPPTLSISMSHSGAFLTGGQAQWAIVVQNSGQAQSNAAVQVSDALPAGLTGATISGAGWTCPPNTTTCTRSDALNPGVQYPAINVTGTIPSGAPAPLTNAATLSWTNGGAPLSASDTAAVSAPPSSGAPSITATITKSETNPASPPDRLWSIKLTNNGTGAATGVKITAANITLQVGSGPVSLVTPLPVSAPDIAAGGAVTVPLVLSFPATTPVTVVQLQLTVTAAGSYSKTIVFNSQLR